jgi:hypothetical protein
MKRKRFCPVIIPVRPDKYRPRLYSQWGLIPKSPLARGIFGAVRAGNANKKMVLDPTVNNFLTVEPKVRRTS